MKVSIEHHDGKCTVEQKDAITHNEALVLFAQALRGAGFFIDCDQVLQWTTEE